MSKRADGRICVSIMVKEVGAVYSFVQEAFEYGASLVELRLDTLGQASLADLRRLATSFLDRCILTCRSSEEGGDFPGSEDERRKVLEDLSTMGAKYLDVELASVEKFGPDHYRSSGSKIIVSWHSAEGTPSYDVLEDGLRRCTKLGDVIKIVATAKKPGDNTNILSLYRKSNVPLVAFCMGELGMMSRVLCLQMGAPFTYSCLPGRETAPGQIPIDELKKLVYLLRIDA